MMVSGYAKTNLDEQERIIAEWKKENGYDDTEVVSSLKEKTAWNNEFLFDRSPEHLARQARKRAEMAARAEMAKAQSFTAQQKTPVKGRPSALSQDELKAKFEAQKAGQCDPNYYYAFHGGKYKRQKRKTNMIGSLYKPYRQRYGELIGDTMAQKIINLLDKHQTIDIAALQSEHKLNRITFLMTAKQLEHKNILRIIKSTEKGNPAKYLERVA